MNKINEVWQEQNHADTFDCWNNFTNNGLKKIYENFNEIKILLELANPKNNSRLLEVGCATGELYRYLSFFHKHIDYYGLDVSEPAIERARIKYSQGNFFVGSSQRLPSLIASDLKINPDILFSRDVIIHQEKPFDFLADLLSIPTDLAIFRIRTRDKGASVLDPEFSCQWYCNHWVPYMILNTDELISFIREKIFFDQLYIYKNYSILGGIYGRYLPKDCYYPETGTAETAIGIKLSKNKNSHPKIVIKEVRELSDNLNIFDKKFIYLLQKLMKVAVRT